MSLEQMLRENLDAAAEAIVVPPARRAPLESPGIGWARRLAFATAGAMAVLALILVPALVVGPPPDDPATEPTGPVQDTAPDLLEETVPETFSGPTTTLAGTTTALDGDPRVIGETATGAHRFTVSAAQTGEDDMPTASLSVNATPAETPDDVIDEIMVGDASMFFWHSVTGSDGLCLLSSSEAETGDSVAILVLLSPSLGCSEPYVYELTGETLTPKDISASDIADLFVEAWQSGSVPAIETLATPEAAGQVADMAAPAEATFNSCVDGAEAGRGIAECTWETTGGTLVVAVSGNEPAPVVTDVDYGDGG
ncbi:MAG: hypothetical protein ACRDX9_09565 [Acidimicrobiia bacterium]